MIGFALVIGAAIAWAVGNIIAKRAAGEHGADMFALTVWSSLVPPLPLAALGYVFEGGPEIFRAVATMSPLAWGCVLVMSYGATLFGFGSWNALLHRYPTALISPFALLIPVSGLASGALFLGESLAPVQFAGVGAGVRRPRLQRLRIAAAGAPRTGWRTPATDRVRPLMTVAAAALFIDASCRSKTGTTIAMPISVLMSSGATIRKRG